jgi:hypothetical protein
LGLNRLQYRPPTVVRPNFTSQIAPGGHFWDEGDLSLPAFHMTLKPRSGQRSLHKFEGFYDRQLMRLVKERNSEAGGWSVL